MCVKYAQAILYIHAMLETVKISNERERERDIWAAIHTRLSLTKINRLLIDFLKKIARASYKSNYFSCLSN